MGAKAAGLLVPGGVFLFGNARERAYDLRELYLTIEDPEWHYGGAIHPDLGLQAREFGAALRQAALALAASDPAGETPARPRPQGRMRRRSSAFSA